MEGLVWHTVTIANGETASAAVDLGKPYRSLLMYVPTITEGTLTITTAMTADGTYQTLNVISTNDADDDAITLSSGTGGINVTVPFFGWQHLKLVGAEQAAARTLYVAGYD